jgi:omega-hydroxy-beta-dihydromenaquinone-9 sulfotransferase
MLLQNFTDYRDVAFESLYFMSIFITGNSRSGTTMMSRIMGNHPDIFTFQELHFFDEILPPSNFDTTISKTNAVKLTAGLMAIQRNGYFGSKNIEPFVEEATHLQKTMQIATHGKTYTSFLNYETLRNSKKIPCEQTPQNIYSIKEILQLLPEAIIIVMVRDPRSVLLSQKNKWKRRSLSGGKIPKLEAIRSRINYHPITISRIWKSVMTTALNYANNPAVLIVKYEDLIHHPEKTIQTVCKHANIDFQIEMLDIPVVGSSNFTDNNTKKGIDKTKGDQWQNNLNGAEIAICQRINGELMNKFGYEKAVIDSSVVSAVFYKITLPFKLALAILFNLKRLKDPVKRVFN